VLFPRVVPFRGRTVADRVLLYRVSSCGKCVQRTTRLALRSLLRRARALPSSDALVPSQRSLNPMGGACVKQSRRVFVRAIRRGSEKDRGWLCSREGDRVRRRHRRRGDKRLMRGDSTRRKPRPGVERSIKRAVRQRGRVADPLRCVEIRRVLGLCDVAQAHGRCRRGLRIALG
jgi:hypothetical protein